MLTGGTLAMSASKDGVLEPTEFGKQLSRTLPELPQVAQIENCNLMVKDSSDVGPDDWRAMAEKIRECYDDFDGFVVVHGTDTMAYSASAISFLLPSLSKPVVFTGSQRPIEEVRSDARVNLVDAVTVATMAVPEVTVCLHSVLLRGNRCRKRSTIDYAAFESPNIPPLGQFGVRIALSPEILKPRGVPGLPLPRTLPLEARVGTLFLTPTTRPEEVEVHAQLETRGLLLMAYGAGNLPVADPALLKAIQALNVPTIVVTQCFHGAADLTLYRGGRALLESGVMDGGDMTPEAALTKLMTGLGVGLEDAELRRYMLSSVAGERRPSE